MHPDSPQWGSFEPVGDARKDREKPVTIWHYLGVVVLSSAVCAGLSYLVLLMSMRTRRNSYSRPAWWESDWMQGVSGETVLAATGAIGAAVGVAIGLYICFRIRRDVIADQKRRAAAALPKPHPFETPLEP